MTGNDISLLEMQATVKDWQGYYNAHNANIFF